MLKASYVEQVLFDVNNAEHRKAFANFLTNASWGAGAPRFILEESNATIPSMITNKLLQYYLEKDKELLE
jgi:hypothetical protein